MNNGIEQLSIPDQRGGINPNALPVHPAEIEVSRLIADARFPSQLGASLLVQIVHAARNGANADFLLQRRLERLGELGVTGEPEGRSLWARVQECKCHTRGAKPNFRIGLPFK